MQLEQYITELEKNYNFREKCKLLIWKAESIGFGAPNQIKQKLKREELCNELKVVAKLTNV